MLELPAIITAVVVAAALGIALTAWLRTSRRRRLEADEAARSLAAMRWREFSRFIIEALQAQGFEQARGDSATQGGQQADLVLERGGETWLLSVKQGADYRVTAKMVDELARAVRTRQARGGILATLGSIEAGVGANYPELELLDGTALWPLVDPLLPPSLHQDIQRRAHVRLRKESALAWAGAVVAGVLAGAAVGAAFEPEAGDVEPPAASAMPAATAPAAAAGAPAVAAPAAPSPAPASAPVDVPADENAAREALARAIGTVTGVERAGWPTRSTLAIYMSSEATDAQVEAICAVVERFDTLSAVRLQLQPPPGAGRVRFLQCRAF